MTSRDCDFDFEVDSEWSKCIYSDCNRSSRTGSGGAGPQCSRNNSSSVYRKWSPPPLPPIVNSDPTSRLKVESTLQRGAHSINISLCVRKHNYENFLWQFVREGVFKSTEAYNNLHLWAVLLRVRMHRRVPFGCLMRGLKGRFGLNSAGEALKFCLDGFYGMPGCGDVFGNHDNDAVPWMEISNQSTADSLRLSDGDIIFVSYSNDRLESLARARKRSQIRNSHPTTARNSVDSTISEVASHVKSGSNSGFPLVGTAQAPVVYRAHRLSGVRPQRARALMHSGHSMLIAEGTSANAQFSVAVLSNSDSELEDSCNDMPAVFTEDGTELLPDALQRLMGLQLQLGDQFQVRYPDCDSAGLGLAMSPELLARLLDASDPAGVSESNRGGRSGSNLRQLLGQTRCRVFKFDARLLDFVVDADPDGGGGGAIGLLDELRRFAGELDARLLRVGGDPDSWKACSVSHFVQDTYLAAAITSAYGIGRDHRLQPHTLDKAMQSLDECFTSSDLNHLQVHRDHLLAKAWDLLYAMHPTISELTDLVPCQRVRQLRDRFKQANETRKNFVGFSISWLYEDYSIKKAAFWAINYLLSNRAVYETLLTEIDDYATETGSGPMEFMRLTLRQIEEMPFLEAFVKEIFRHTSGQFIKFQTTGRFRLRTQTWSGVKYKEGCKIGVLLRSLNMNPRLFHNPGAFRPQRFLPPSRDSDHPHSLPYGAMSTGRWIGLLKMKLYLILLLSRCSIRQSASAPAVKPKINNRLYGMDVLPSQRDFNFEYRARCTLTGGNKGRYS